VLHAQRISILLPNNILWGAQISKLHVYVIFPAALLPRPHWGQNIFLCCLLSNCTLVRKYKLVAGPGRCEKSGSSYVPLEHNSQVAVVCFRANIVVLFDRQIWNIFC
jgi:hypothetical protein